MEFRRHLLRLYALTAFLVIVVNESLLAADAPLGMRVAILSVLTVALHYRFEIMLRLTSPSLEDGHGRSSYRLRVSSRNTSCKSACSVRTSRMWMPASRTAASTVSAGIWEEL